MYAGKGVSLGYGWIALLALGLGGIGSKSLLLRQLFDVSQTAEVCQVMILRYLKATL